MGKRGYRDGLKRPEGNCPSAPDSEYRKAVAAVVFGPFLSEVLQEALR
jgi:hypothetical protein